MRDEVGGVQDGDCGCEGREGVDGDAGEGPRFHEAGQCLSVCVCVCVCVCSME